MPIPDDITGSFYTDIDAASFEALELRALVELLNKRDNYLTNRIIELQDALALVKSTGGTAANRLNALPNNYLATNT